MKCGFLTIIKAGLLLSLCYVMNANAANAFECMPVDGNPKTFSPNFGNYTITDPSKNVAGQIFENATGWSTDDSASMTCECSDINYPLDRYFSSLSYQIVDQTIDGLAYYKISDYLDAGVYIWISGNLNQYVPVPFTSVDNKRADNEGCKHADLNPVANDVNTGNKGKINLRIRKPFVGTAYFNNIRLVGIHVARHAKMGLGPNSIIDIYLSGSVNVPQSCIINAGDIISVDFGQILSGDFKEKGQIPNGHTAVPVSVPIKCAGMNASANLSMRFQADVSTADSDAIASDNSDIGVKIQDDNGSVITPNTGLIPFSLDDNQQANVSFHVYPVSTTGNAPKQGVFHAQAYLRVDFN